MEQDKERRRSSRIKRALTVQYGWRLETGQIKWDMSSVQDISEAGILIAAARDFSVGEILSLRIMFPNKPFQKVEFTGKVVETKRQGAITRVEFAELTEEQKKAIKEYAEWFMSAPFPPTYFIACAGMLPVNAPALFMSTCWA